MKKKLLTAGILIGIGGLLIMGGYAFGGKPYMIGAVTGCDTQITQTVPEDGEFVSLKSSGIVHLKCKANSGYLTILGHDKRDFVYSIQNNTEREKASVYSMGNTLYIETVKKPRRPFGGLGALWYGFRNTKPPTAITVYVPRNFTFETVIIESGAARIKIEDFAVSRQFTLNGGVGETIVRNITAAAAKIDVGVGKNSFTDCVFTDMQLETGVGENVFSGILYGRTMIETGIGRTTITIAGNREDYDLALNAGIGGIYIDHHRISQGFDPDVSSQKNKRNSDNTIHVHSGIGEVYINFSDSKDTGTI